MRAKAAGRTAKLTDALWVRAPAVVGRQSLLLGSALADGQYMRAWPALALALLPMSAVVGFAVGAGHPGDLYSYSLVLTTLLAACSSFGAAYGVWLLGGFVIGDLLLGREPGSALGLSVGLDGVRAVTALVVSYLLLAGLLILIPLVITVLRLAMTARLSRYEWASVVTDGTMVLVAALLAFCWTQSTPFLIRPVWSYFGGSPDVAAIEPLQQRGWILAVVVGLATVARLLLERRSSALLWKGVDLPTPSGHARPWLATVVARSVFVTLLLSGLLESVIVALLTLVMVGAITALQVRILPNLPGYMKVVRRVPLAARALSVLLVAYLLGVLIVEGARDRGSNSFVSLVVATLVSLACVAVLLPAGPVDRASPHQEAVPR